MFLKDKIEEAVNSGKYFITISFKDGSKKENDLQHYWVTHDYPQKDIFSSLDHIRNDIYIKEIKSEIDISSQAKKP